MHIAIVTAGGAGMFCGSCMHDNTWARALGDAGLEVSLVPMYTPIRVDETNATTTPVFMGGINVYLDYAVPFWSRLPRFLVRWLDRPWVLNLASKLGVSNDAAKLGPLTLAMLDGENGPHRREVNELVEFIAGQLKPDAVFFTNALLSGVLPPLRRAFDGGLHCILQGDDVFLNDLVEPHRSLAIRRIRENAEHFDGFVVHSDYYRDYTSDAFGLPRGKYHRVPLGIDLAPHDGLPVDRGNDTFTVGYFARICPEKGLHRLVEAFEKLHERHPSTRLRAGGYLGPRDRAYFRQLSKRTRRLGDAFEFIGSPESHAEKVAFYKSIDVLSVPTEYREPKGLYVLESLANGTPVVLPRHGAFPEHVAATGGGLLVPPNDPTALADALESLMLDPERRLALARSGHDRVMRHYGPDAMVAGTLAMLDGGSVGAQ